MLRAALLWPARGFHAAWLTLIVASGWAIVVAVAAADVGTPQRANPVFFLTTGMAFAVGLTLNIARATDLVAARRGWRARGYYLVQLCWISLAIIWTLTLASAAGRHTLLAVGAAILPIAYVATVALVGLIEARAFYVQDGPPARFRPW